MALVSYSFVVPPMLVIDALPITATHMPHDDTEDARGCDLQLGGDRLSAELQHAGRHAAPPSTKQVGGVISARQLQLCRAAVARDRRAAYHGHPYAS